MSKTCIRRFQKKDLDETTEIVIDAFGSKYGKLPNRNPEKFYNMIKDSVDQGNHIGNIVAELDGKVVGFLHLYSPIMPIKKSKTKWLKFTKKYGLKDAFRFLLTTLFLDFTWVKNDECYVAHIGVSPDARGKGIGTQLLEYGEKEALKYKAIKKYTLCVWKENEGAYKLYTRVGFKNELELKSALFKRLLGYYTAIFMAKKLRVS